VNKIERHYEIHGRRLTVRAPGAQAASMLDHVFSAYAIDDLESRDLLVDIAHVDPDTLLEERTFAGCAEDGTRFSRDERGDLYVEVDGLGAARIDARNPGARVAICVEDPDWEVGHRLVEPVVVELLRGRSLYGIHAGAVATADGHALLLCGRSGSGKSTTALALARSGWGFLADDTCYLDTGAAPARIAARWSDVHLTETSLEVLIPAAGRGAAIRPRGSEKYFLRVDRVPDLRPVAQAVPKWIVFPRIEDRDDAELVDLEPDAALSRIVPQSLVPGRSGIDSAHFDALVALCGACRCAELRSGRNLGAVVGVLQGYVGCS